MTVVEELKVFKKKIGICLRLILLLLSIVRCGDQVSTRCLYIFVKKRKKQPNVFGAVNKQKVRAWDISISFHPLPFTSPSSSQSISCGRSAFHRE